MKILILFKRYALRSLGIFSIFTKLKRIMAYIVIPFLICSVGQTFYSYCNSGYGKKAFIPSYILGFIIFEAFFLLFAAITKHTKWATIIMCSCGFIYLVGSQFKIYYTFDPIMISDFLFLNDAGSLMEIMGDTFFDTLLSLLPAILVMLALFIIICKLAFKTDRHFYTPWRRIPCLVLSIIFIVALFIPRTPVSAIMKKTFFEVTAEKDNHTTTNIAYYNKHGVISGIYGLYLTNQLEKPEDYEKTIAALEKELEELGNSSNNNSSSQNWGQPNIIMVFSEAFWDISKMDDIKFDKEVTSNFNALKEEGIYFEMISPSFGGISANVEFEVLTGSSLRYYGTGYIPYMQLMTSDKYANMPNVPTELNNNGYNTKIISTWSDKLFKCKNAYEYFKVNETLYNTDFKDPDKKGGRISEKEVVDTLISQMENKKDDERVFLMALTAQTHMPYPKDRYAEEEYDIKVSDDSGLPEYVTDSLRCYAQGVYDADKELARLYEYVKTLDEPTIIIFYGDHLPYINQEDGSDAYPIMNYFNTDDELMNTYRKYNTQCLILGNFDLGEDDVDTLGPNMIMPYVFRKCNLNVSPYFRWLGTKTDSGETSNHIVAGNPLVAMDSKGNLYTPGTLTGELAKDNNEQACINWKYFVEVDVD